MKYVCELCGMIYDEELGDAKRGIPAGTEFADLPAYYSCSRCGSEREAFTKVTVRRRIIRTGATPAFWQNAKYSDLCFESDR